jgi:membrane protease YdiL (CAAX protease family)
MLLACLCTAVLYREQLNFRALALPQRRSKLSQAWPEIVRLVSFNLAFAFAIAGWALHFGWLRVEESHAVPQSPVSAFLLIVVVAPIVEELVFRWLLWGRLLQKYSKGFSMAINAAAFALIHFEFPATRIFISLALCAVMLRHQKLIFSIALHALNNFCVLLLVWADTSSNATNGGTSSALELSVIMTVFAALLAPWAVRYVVQSTTGDHAADREVASASLAKVPM